MKYPQIESEKIVFREQFLDVVSVVKNGGTVSGSPTISRGATLNGSSEAINYADLTGKVKSVSFVVELESTTEDMVDLDGGTHTIEASAGTLTATGFSSPTIYVDGAVTSTITTAKSTVTVTTATAIDLSDPTVGLIGASYMEGTVSEITLYEEELSAEEVLDAHEKDSQTEIEEEDFLLSLPLIAHYDNTLDERVTENTGSLGGQVYYGTGILSSAFPTQLKPKGIQCDGSTEYLSEDGSNLAIASLRITGDITFGCLVRVDSAPSSDSSTIIGQVLEGESLATNALYMMNVNTDLGLAYLHEYNNGENATKEDFTATLPIGVWKHAYMVRDLSAQTVDLYIDGEFSEQYDFSGADDPEDGSTTKFWIGVNEGFDPDRFSPISVIQPRVGAFAASPAQIRELYRRDIKLINT